jgi:hypothetical protein
MEGTSNEGSGKAAGNMEERRREEEEGRREEKDTLKEIGRSEI